MPEWENQESHIKEAWEVGAQAVLMAALGPEQTIQKVVRRDREGEEIQPD